MFGGSDNKLVDLVYMKLLAPSVAIQLFSFKRKTVFAPKYRSPNTPAASGRHKS